MAVRIVVREEVFIQGLPEELVKFFCEENTFHNPKVDQLERMGKWTGRTPRNIVLWRKKDDWLSLPRGYFPDVVATLQERGISPPIEHATVCPPLSIPPLKPTGELFNYQNTALRSLIQAHTGVMESPTGSGKTQILLTLAAMVPTPTLIIVHTTELLKQTAARCESWLNYSPGIIGGGKNQPKDITVGMIQTLAKMNIGKDHPLYARFGCVIGDEIHHCPAATYVDVFRRLPYRYKYGFTATAWRKDKMEPVLFRILGPITAKVHHQDVVDAGRIVWPEVRFINTDYYYPIDDPSQWTQMISDLATNEQRNLFIAGHIRDHLHSLPDARGLVLTDRIEHANILAEMAHLWNPVVLTGELKKSEREKAMERIRAGARLTIATVHLLGEGVDVPGWGLLFLVSPFSGGPRTLQAVGRIARPAPGKDKALLIDFVDSRIGILAGAAKARARLYRSKGEK
jgi:superfamily II DNA or RNA helicase